MKGLRIYLVHWNDEERIRRAEQLRALGYKVVQEISSSSAFLRKLEEVRPAAVAIDMTRIPSQGRDLGIAIRKRKGTRHIPLVFTGGDDKKLKKVKELLPDAHYCGWEKIGECIENAVKEGAADLIIPDSVFAAYQGKQIAAKLGIKEGDQLLVLGAPPNLDEILVGLPRATKLTTSMDQHVNLALCFVKTLEDLDRRLVDISDLSRRSPVWVAWPKKKSGVSSDLSQTSIREICMQAGMVDYKICSIDPTWSALLFTWRGKVRDHD